MIPKNGAHEVAVHDALPGVFQLADVRIGLALGPAASSDAEEKEQHKFRFWKAHIKFTL
ncbi:MAG: hypothetical protein ONB45_21930 [candidate division KSB1 bacterium]|nr:hypothetical protein [candidate division KSB1 bacterium]